MKQNNANVILYTEWCPLISSLPDEKRLKLFDMILRFHEETPEISDPHLRSVFDFISLKIRENQEKYLEKCAKAKEAIAKRWEKKEEEKQDESGNESNTDVYE